MANPNPKTGHLQPAWKPGQSGNPLGRPKGRISLTRMLQERLKDREVGGQETPDGRMNAEWLIDQMIVLAMKGNASYMKEIMDRNDGKIPDPEPESDSEEIVEELRRRRAKNAKQGGPGNPG